MSNKPTLSKVVRDSVKGNNLVPAAVVETMGGNRASVRLSGSGQVLRNVFVTGGIVKKGQNVYVDLGTKPFNIIAGGIEQISDLKIRNEAKLQANKTVMLEKQSIQSQPYISLYHNGVVNSYEPNTNGFEAALSASAEGDIIYISNAIIEGDFNISGGRSLVGMSSIHSIIQGSLTLGSGTLIQNLKVINETTSGFATAIIAAGNSEDPSKIKDCEIHSYNIGTEDAFAIVVTGTSYLQIEDSVIMAECVNGLKTSYPFNLGVNSLTIAKGCLLFGTSGQYLFQDGTAIVKESGNAVLESSEIS